MSVIELTLTIKDRPAFITCEVEGPDPSVGIMEPCVTSMSGIWEDDETEVPQALVEAESDRICELAAEAWYEGEA